MATQRTRLNRIRILLLGAADVGKTAFVVRLITKRFIGEYDQNKEMLYTHRLSGADRDDVTLEILDAANSADDTQLETNIKWAEAFLLMFSVTDRHSFARLDHYLAQIFQHRRHDDGTPSVVIVANKTDCPAHARCVTSDEAHTLAARIERPLCELSVAEGPDGVVRAIDDVVRQVRQRELVKAKAGPGMDRLSTFTSVRRVLREKIYKGSRSDTWMMTSGLEKFGK